MPAGTRRDVRLEVLGAVALRGADGTDTGVLAQPKRLALLVYLVLRHPHGFVRRDELLGTFWAESPEGRARAALRQALRFLRRRLGSEVLINRGDAEVRAGSLDCDALELHDAIGRGDDEAVVELYAGDLMPGFFLDEARGFDRWLRAERQRLRAAAVAAVLRLADAAEAHGDVEGASDRLRWALRRDPTNESVARRLISVLAGRGNRGGALEVYEELAEALRADLDLEPSEETVRMYAAVRAGREAVGAAAGLSRGRQGTLSPRRILVADLRNRTSDPELDWIGRFCAERIAQGLSTLEELEVVPPFAVGPLASLAAMADRAGAGTVVAGTYHLDGQELQFQLHITDVSGRRLLPGPEPVRAPPAEPMDAVERLREAAMTSLGPALSRRSVHVRQAARPPGVAAYRSYLDGLDLFIRGEWRSALEHFRRATELSPDYALPRIVSGISLWNLGQLSEAHAVAEEAHALRGSLGRFEREVLDNLRAWLVGDWAAAYRSARAQAELAPGSIPHFQVAEEARRLNRPREAREVLAELDPERGEMRGWIYYWLELSTAHHLLGDHARELEAASRARQAHPDDPTAALCELRALAALGRTADVLRVADQALASPPTRQPGAGELLVEAALELNAHGHAGDAEPLLTSAVDWYRRRIEAGADDTRDTRRAYARALYHAGDLESARTLFSDLVRTSAGPPHPLGHHHGHLQGHLDEGYLAVIAARTGDTDEAVRWRARLEDIDGPFLYGADWFWLAALDALEGRGSDRAVLRLRRAFADGLPMGLCIHQDPHLALLRGNERFDALVRPRG